MNRSNGRIRFLECPVDALTMEGTVARVLEMIASGTPHIHASLNASKVVAMHKNAQLARALQRADLVSADGQSVVWASRLFGLSFPERIAGIDLMARLLEEAQRLRLSVFFLGATDQILTDLISRVQRRHPELRIAGAHHGYFARTEEVDVIQRIKRTEPHILFVGISSPRKELWLDQYRDQLAVPFSMGVGGSFDVLAGHRRRCPKWARQLGLEWCFRLLQEPRRMWRRYLLGNVAFVWLVLRALAKK